MLRSNSAGACRTGVVAAHIAVCLGLCAVRSTGRTSEYAVDAEPSITLLNAGELVPVHPVEEHAEWVFGGISGVERVALLNRDGVTLFLPDDRGKHGPPRIGVGVTGFGGPHDNRPSHFSLGELEWYALLDTHGEPFSANTADPEGIRVLESRDRQLPVVVWTSEGYVRGGSDPAVYVWDMTEDRSHALDIPEAYLPSFDDDGKQVRGITHNRGFESVAVLNDGSFLIAPENPPVQDEREDMPRLLRVTRYTDREASETLWYPMRPTLPGANPRKHGVSEMLALDDYQLLVIERALDGNDVQHAWLVEADLTTPPGMPLRTRVIFDFRSVEEKLPGGVVPNVEAMTLGPIAGVPGHQSRRTLLVVSDNDFDDEVPTVWIALDLGE